MLETGTNELLMDDVTRQAELLKNNKNHNLTDML